MNDNKVSDKISVNNSGWVSLRQFDDGNDGTLCILEAQRDIPFEVKRVYYITNLQNARSCRGKHAHKTLRQAIFCISGSFVLGLDDGYNRQDVRMWRNNQGVLLEPMLWHTMSDFSSGCVLMVVANEYYDAIDYIRNYEEFRQYARKL